MGRQLLAPFADNLATQRSLITSYVLIDAAGNLYHAQALVRQFLALLADDPAAQRSLITPPVLRSAADNPTHAFALITQLLAYFANDPTAKKSLITSSLRQGESFLDQARRFGTADVVALLERALREE